MAREDWAFDDLMDNLPPGVCAAASAVEAPEGELFDVEKAYVDRAVSSRRREFATGRWCAHRALERLGVGRRPVPTGPHREPVWPEGVVGSITHCEGLRLAVVAYRRDYVSLGVDAEPHRLLPREVLPVIITREDERLAARWDEAALRIHWQTVVFSAKESVYKTWFPVMGRWLDFCDCAIRLEPSGRFTVHPLFPESPAARWVRAIDGRWAVVGSHILTVATVSHGRGEHEGVPGPSGGFKR